VSTRVARFLSVQTFQNGEICTKSSKTKIHITSGHRKYQHFPYQGPPKYTQIGICGLKINHLATLVSTVARQAIRFWLSFTRITIKPLGRQWLGG
jgi:hypothetical protein